MSPPLTPSAAAYLGAVALQIQKKLQRVCFSLAIAEPKFAARVVRRHSFGVFDYVSYLLLVATYIIFDEEDVVYVAEDGYGRAYCFYDVLADYFVCIPQSGDSIIDLIVQSFASNIVFCLLFYKQKSGNGGFSSESGLWEATIIVLGDRLYKVTHLITLIW
ncbi:hypothetical protein SASPL_104450 [Salvia splendens]|uniref:Uncharacterized protein n=1 Tax=Salvia splendens TaxID=180675 RepID=A0A8X8YLN5_SALSN|nr:hypothetical protein SASPL_104450 [Salvia splendens]